MVKIAGWAQYFELVSLERFHFQGCLSPFVWNGRAKNWPTETIKWIRANGRLQLNSQLLRNNVKNTVLRMQFHVLFFSGPIFLYLLDVTLGTREVNNTSRFSDRKNHPLSQLNRRKNDYILKISYSFTKSFER